jgi:hypothetical protein
MHNMISKAPALLRAVEVGQRQAGEAAEPVGAVAGQFGGQFVAPPGQGARGGVVAGVHAGGADRGDGDVDAGVVEDGERARARPGRRRYAANRMVALVGGPPEEIGQHVVVDVHGEGHGSLHVAGENGRAIKQGPDARGGPGGHDGEDPPAGVTDGHSWPLRVDSWPLRATARMWRR